MRLQSSGPIGLYFLTCSLGLACSGRPPVGSDTSPHQVHCVTVDDGVQLEVLEWGRAGRPIVLRAGSGNSAHIFYGFAEQLTGMGRVYGITRRGYGNSSHPDSGYSERRLAEDVRQAFDSLKI